MSKPFPHRSTALLASVAVAAAVVTGCANSDTTGGSTESSLPTTSAESVEVAKPTEAGKPTGAPVGTATMEVTGGTGPVTIRYSINGAAEQTETDVTLPWTKDYPVYDQVSSSVSAQGASGCTITMKGMLVSFKNEADPTCNFAHYD